MDPLELLRLNLLSPVVLAFGLGLVATAVRSDLRFPEEIYTALSIYLLLAIGLKGGAELAATTFAAFWRPALAALVIGVVTPLTAYLCARRLGGLSVSDAAALAAHYGSVSVVTFFAALSFLASVAAPVEPFMPTLVALLEVPAIIVGLSIARRRMGQGSWGGVLHEVVTGRSVFLLVGGLVIGYLVGHQGLAPVAPVFVAPFQGLLMLFLLDLGMVAARRLKELAGRRRFLLAFGIGVPTLHAGFGVALGTLAGLSQGGAMVLGILAASASYIAAPAAVRLALPEANPSLYLTATLGITFPFNLMVGIPLCYWMARLLGS